MKQYLVTLLHDGGKMILHVPATDEKAARHMVMEAEGCPPSAIESVSLESDESDKGSRGAVYVVIGTVLAGMSLFSGVWLAFDQAAKSGPKTAMLLFCALGILVGAAFVYNAKKWARS